MFKTVARLRWFRQVQRRDGEDIGYPPKRRLIDVVKEDMKVTGVREEDAEDRVIWRPLFRCGDPRREKPEGEEIRYQVFCNLKHAD